MEIEPLNTMNESMYLSLLMIKVIMLMTIVFVIAALAIYLVGTAWLCFEEKRRSRTAPRARRALPPTPWMSMSGVPNAQVRLPSGNQQRADATGRVSSPGLFLVTAASTLPVKASKAGSIHNVTTRI
jgi:hypothetical protein